MADWSEWRPFPDPRKAELLTAPIGPGCYELRQDDQLLLFGRGGNVASRMCSLLPLPWGGGGMRKNDAKRKAVFDGLGTVQYRTLACTDTDEAKREEDRMRANRHLYRFKT